MAANFEYWTAVFPVGLDGFSDFDHEELNAIAAEGWEPVQVTAVHSGFATLVLFRRELVPSRVKPPAPKQMAAPAKKADTKKPPAKKAAAKRGR